jgi:hypothetical protein
MMGSVTELPTLGKKFGVEILAGPIVSTEHKSVSIVKAPNAKAVRDFVMESGMIQWNEIEIMNGVPLPEAVEEISKLKPIY